MSHLVAILLSPFLVLCALLHFITLGLSLLLRAKGLEDRAMVHLVALDHYANSLLGGHHLETISSRMGKLLHTDKCILCKWTCRFLDFFDKDHCIKSIKQD